MTNISVIRENIQAIRDENHDESYNVFINDHVSAIETAVELMEKKHKRMAVSLYWALVKAVGEDNVKQCIKDAKHEYDLQKAFNDIEGLLEATNDSPKK